MATTTQVAEFTIQRKHTTNRRSPLRWIISHTIRYWWLVLIMFIGAVGMQPCPPMCPY